MSIGQSPMDKKNYDDYGINDSVERHFLYEHQCIHLYTLGLDSFIETL